jgi:hypothetical protein
MEAIEQIMDGLKHIYFFKLVKKQHAQKNKGEQYTFILLIKP